MNVVTRTTTHNLAIVAVSEVGYEIEYFAGINAVIDSEHRVCPFHAVAKRTVVCRHLTESKVGKPSLIYVYESDVHVILLFVHSAKLLIYPFISNLS